MLAEFEIEIDSELSETSLNAVQNKVVTEALSQLDTFEKGSGKNSVILKGGENEASGRYASACGYRTRATGPGATTEGSDTEASGFASHSEGVGTYSRGYGSHSEGIGTKSGTNGYYISAVDYAQNKLYLTGTYNGIMPATSSFNNYIESIEIPYIVGDEVIIIGNDATSIKAHIESVEGNTIIVDKLHDLGQTSSVKYYMYCVYSADLYLYGESELGFGAHAEGGWTKSMGPCSHTSGLHTEARNIAEAAFGKFNRSNEETLHSVGIGHSEEDRRNASETTQDGRHYILGVGGFDGTNRESSTDLANEIDRIFKNLSSQYIPLSIKGYITASGTESTLSTAMRTDYIAIANYNRLKGKSKISSSGCLVAFFDKNRTLIPELSILGKGGGYITFDVDLNLPEYKDATYVCLSCYDTGKDFSDFFAILYNANSAAETIDHWMLRTCDKDGLNILIFGDSITACSVITTDVNGRTDSYKLKSNSASYINKNGTTVTYSLWPYLLTEIFKCNDVRNYALSGASYIDKERAAGQELKNLSAQIDLALKDRDNPNGVFPTTGAFVPDIVIFALGTNDSSPNDTYETAMAKSVMSGKQILVPETLGNLDTTKFCEAARKAFMRVREAFPTSQMFCILPPQKFAWEQSTEGVNNELRKMAQRYGMVIIDAAAESGIVRDFESSTDNEGTLLKDSVHPNALGQKVYTRMIARYINQYIPISGL